MDSSQGSANQESLGIDEDQKEQFGKALGEISDSFFRRGMPPKEVFEVDNRILENIYSQAYRQYNTGKYTEASHLFRILIMMDSSEEKYMLGLAACFHMLKEYDNALNSYTLCSSINPKNPIPYYHSSDCYIQLQDYLSAMITLEITIVRAGDNPEYAKMKERAILTLESLKQQESVADNSPKEQD